MMRANVNRAKLRNGVAAIFVTNFVITTVLVAVRRLATIAGVDSIVRITTAFPGQSWLVFLSLLVPCAIPVVLILSLVKNLKWLEYYVLVVCGVGFAFLTKFLWDLFYGTLIVNGGG